MLSVQKIRVIGGRLLDPKYYDEKGRNQKDPFHVLQTELILGRWQINVDLAKRLLIVRGANSATYPLMDGVLVLVQKKIRNKTDSYFAKFYDERSVKFLEKYGIDSVITCNPNHYYHFKNSVIVCSDGHVIKNVNGFSVNGANYVLVYVKDDWTNYDSVFTYDASTFLKEKPKNTKCFLYTVDGAITLDAILQGSVRI